MGSSKEAMAMEIRWDPAWGTLAAGWMLLDAGGNPPVSEALEAECRRTEEELRRRHDGADRGALKDLPVYRDYEAYYRRFGKSYHVRMQLESILKGKKVPPVSTLVTPLFLAELETGVLSAGYDPLRLAFPLEARPGREGETYGLLGKGREQAVVPGDLALADQGGVVGTILHGPDQRTCLDRDSRGALYVVYPVPGLRAETVHRHLDRVRDLVRLVLPEAAEEERVVLEGPGV